MLQETAGGGGVFEAVQEEGLCSACWRWCESASWPRSDWVTPSVGVTAEFESCSCRCRSDSSRGLCRKAAHLLTSGQRPLANSFTQRSVSQEGSHIQSMVRRKQMSSSSNLRATWWDDFRIALLIELASLKVMNRILWCHPVTPSCWVKMVCSDLSAREACYFLINAIRPPAELHSTHVGISIAPFYLHHTRVRSECLFNVTSVHLMWIIPQQWECI